MAVLTTEDFRQLRSVIYQGSSASKQALKAFASGVPTGEQLKAAFQALEDRYTADRLNYKAALDAALGQTTTIALAKEFERVWHEWWAEKNK